MKSLIVDRQALKKNISVIKNYAEGTPIYAVVKGDGYGLGIVEYSKLLRDEGITRFAVTEPSEATALRKSGFTEEEILMLRSTTSREELEELIDANTICTVGSYDAAVALNGIAESRSTVAEAHIKIDTGMGRYGFLPSEWDKIVSVFQYMANIAVSGMYTHFHSAFCDRKSVLNQLETFKTVVGLISKKGYETGIIHACNSSALFKAPESKLDAVRIGSAFLGRLSFPGSYGLEKIGYIETTVEQVRWLPKGSTVGYGAVYKARKATKTAVLPIGWYHGFNAEKGRDIFRFKDCVVGILSLVKSFVTGKRVYVKINGKRARVLGHIGMLHTVADVTDIECSIGDIAVMEVNPLLAKGLEIEYR